MLQAGRDLRLAPEAAQVLAIVGERVGEDLYRDRAVEPLVAGEPNSGHAAVAEHALEAVAPAQASTSGDDGGLGDPAPVPVPRCVKGLELVGRLIVVIHDQLDVPARGRA